MTSIKVALNRWSEANEKAEPTKATSIELQFQNPPIQKMDKLLSTLVNCEFLSLSTNTIPQIAGLQGMQNLKILSLARNNIRSFNGLQPVAKTLEQLWISYNYIEKTRGIEVLQNLTLLSMTFNLVKDWAEFARIGQLKKLTDLNFIGNPVIADMDEDDWMVLGKKKIPRLELLEGNFLGTEEKEEEPDEGDGKIDIEKIIGEAGIEVGEEEKEVEEMGKETDLEADPDADDEEED